jgi:uncharacterized tellurite resistance protein B-like protein
MTLANFNEPQRQALLDLVVLAVYADGHVASGEDERVRRLLDGMGVVSDYERNRLFDASVTRVRQHVKTAETVRAHAVDLARNFATTEHRGEVEGIVDDVLASDSQVAPEEAQFATIVKAVLETNP